VRDSREATLDLVDFDLHDHNGSAEVTQPGDALAQLPPLVNDLRMPA